MLRNMFRGITYAILITLRLQLFLCDCILGSSRLEDTDVSLNSYAYLRCSLKWDDAVCNATLQYIDYYKCTINRTKCRQVFRYMHFNKTTISFIYGDYTLEGRSSLDEFSNYQRLRIDLINLDDEGLWNCKVTYGYESFFQAESAKLTVYVQPFTSDFMISHNKTNCAATLPTEFTCTIARMRPQENIVWSVNNRLWLTDANPQFQLNDDGTYYMISTTHLQLEFHTTNDITCSVERTPGVSWRTSNSLSIQSVVSPPVAEFPVHAKIIHTSVNDDLTLQCVFAGTSNITWRKDGRDIPADLFESPDLRIIQGEFAYNQSEAWVSEITWHKPGLDAACSSLDQYSGVYSCVGLIDEYSEFPVESIETIVRTHCDRDPGLSSGTVAAIAVLSVLVVIFISTTIGAVWYFRFKRDANGKSSSIETDGQANEETDYENQTNKAAGNVVKSVEPVHRSANNCNTGASDYERLRPTLTYVNAGFHKPSTSKDS